MKETKFQNFSSNFLVKLLLNQESQALENAGNMPNGLRRDKFGQGLPPLQVIFKKMAKIGRDRTWKFKKCSENVNFLDKYLC